MTKTDVFNLALTNLGKDMINSDTEKSTNAKKCNLVYGFAAKEVLRKGEFQSSIAYTELDTESSDTNERNDEYEYMFDIPSDCLKVLDIADGSDLTYSRLVEGTYIYSNYSTLHLRYVKDITEEVTGALLYNEEVAQAIAWKMTAMLAPSMNPEVLGIAQQMSLNGLKTAMEQNQDESREQYDGSTLWDEVY
jgi:hypothetical protein